MYSELKEFQSYEKYMYSAVYSVIRQVGGDFEEMRSELWLLFKKAKTNYKAEKGRPFRSYLYRVVWDDLYAARRIQVHRDHNHPMKAITDKFDIAGRRYFDFTMFLQELSDEAKAAVQFVIAPPVPVKVCQDGTPKQKSVIAAMRNHFNWTTTQFAAVCEEIRAAL